jgi:hypothetical protein
LKFTFRGRQLGGLFPTESIIYDHDRVPPTGPQVIFPTQREILLKDASVTCVTAQDTRSDYLMFEAHGVGKRGGDWPCHHQGRLPIDRFQADEVLQDIERRCRCTVCGWQRADLRPDYSKQQAAWQSVGWMMPPG